MPKTLREKYIEALKLEGYKQIKETHKYIVFQRSGDSYWYIGRSGSLRVGRTIATSVPVNEKAKSFFLSRCGMPPLMGTEQ